MDRIPLQHGRLLFGNDPETYANARPDYPMELYEILSKRCGLRLGISAFEVGPGSGVATKQLLAMGVSHLRAIEPDSNFANYLRRNFRTDLLLVDGCPFEEADLPLSTFDLGIAATSFHWLDQPAALAKTRGALKPGGWWAMWWTHFGAGNAPDPFQVATGHLFVQTPQSPGISNNGVPFALDQDARLADLSRAGFENSAVEVWRWNCTYQIPHLIELYRTFSSVQALSPERQEKLLSDLANIANRSFGGKVERTFLTILYTAQRARSSTIG